MFKYIELPATDNDIMPWIAYAFRITGPLRGESMDPQWILPIKGQQWRALIFSVILARASCETSIWIVSDFRRHGAHMTSL